jgi:isoquinoline 1-oxidoreductase alpha subunit
MTTLKINGKAHTISVPEDMPLSWAIRDHVGLTGTKYGCGEGDCGNCTVLINGKAELSCKTKVSEAVGKNITTIEGIGATVTGKAVQAAWISVGVAQCGYCQPGMIVAATALLQQNPKPSDAAIDEAMNDNLCRCGTYTRIRTAIRQAAESRSGNAKGRLSNQSGIDSAIKVAAGIEEKTA